MSKMMRNYLIGLSIAIVIYAVVVSWMIRRDIIVPPEVIDTIILFILASATIFYAIRTSDIAKATIEQAAATKKQANASIQAVEEMRNARYDTLRPIIDIVEPILEPGEMATRAYNAREGIFPKYLPCRLRNVGVGPAIEVYSFIEDDRGETHRWDFHTIPVAIGKEQMGYTDEMRLLLEQRGNHRALVVYYKDVYGNSLESIREVSVNKDKGAVNISPLKVRPLPKKEHGE